MVPGPQDTVPLDDATGDDSSSSVSCSICLDMVTDDGDRSTAKLQCGHQFHLDCIGSAFNMKGAMQCPNCRQIEKGRWLYAIGSARSFLDISMDDWSTPNEDSYELSYSEMPFGVHWCPFSGLTRVHSSFEELESPSTTYPDLPGNHPIFSEHTAASSLPHSYVAYLQPLPSPASPNSSENLDDPNFSHRWNGGPFGHNEIYTPFPANSIQYQGWGRHAPHRHPPNSSHMNNNVTPRSGRADSDSLTRSGSTVNPFIHGHGSVPRGGFPFVSSIVHPSTNPRYHHISHPTHRQQQPGNPTGMPLSIIPGVRRFIGPRGLPLPAVMPSDHHSRGFYIFPPLGSSGRTPHEAENHLLSHPNPPLETEHPSRFPIMSFDRDSARGSAHHSNSGSNSGNRSVSLWQSRH